MLTADNHAHPMVAATKKPMMVAADCDPDEIPITAARTTMPVATE